MQGVNKLANLDPFQLPQPTCPLPLKLSGLLLRIPCAGC